MTLQMRGAGDMATVRYTPTRDINHIYPHVVGEVERSLYADRSQFLAALMRQLQVSDEDKARAIRAYCVFLNLALEQPDKNAVECLRLSGWDDCAQGAKLAVYFWIGSLMTGTFFSGIREEVMLGDDKPPEIKDLLFVADRVQRYSLSGRFVRWLIRLKHRWLPTRLKQRYTIHGR